MTEAVFRPVDAVDGYLPIADHGLIGDGTTAALVGRDGAVVWLCVPRFDGEPLFCRMLDAERGGAFELTPEGLVESRQFYRTDSAVLVTELRSPTGLVQVTDALPLRSGANLSEDVAAGRCELLRVVRVLEGEVRLRVAVAPSGEGTAVRRGGGVGIRWSQDPRRDLLLSSSAPLAGLETTLDLQAGDQHHFVLQWRRGARRYESRDPEELIKETVAAWQRWLRAFNYDGPRVDLVRRSAITIKLLDYLETGAIVAAPTSSLPEVIGGERNWDYRYSWVRDTAYSVYALRRIGLTGEAWLFLNWVLGLSERDDRLRILYDLDGQPPPPEQTDPLLDGYRASVPVRWGNAAADQIQHDIHGEVVDCAYQWASHGGALDDWLWERLHVHIERARAVWRRPDQGIWEVRTAGRPFTYSAALCQVALDRGATLAERHHLPGDIAGWRQEAARIREAVLTESWDPTLNSLTEHLGGGGLDASLLALPLRRVIPAEHPRMVATTAAIQNYLGAGNGLLYRYLHEESPDGLSGMEGAFLLCSFWLVDNLANQGRLDEAMDLYDTLCDRAGPLGLLPEEIDPVSGAFLGNYPQGFSHIGLISSGANLARLLRQGT